MSVGEIEQQQASGNAYKAFLQITQHYYNKLLEFGVAKEQAHVMLPLGAN